MPDFNSESLSKKIGRRKKNRLKTSFLASWHFLDNEDVVYDAEVINISSEGACILRSTIINPGEKIILFFNFENKKVSMQCTVLNIVGREVSVKFDASDDDKYDFIKMFNKEISKNDGNISLTFKSSSILKKLE